MKSSLFASIALLFLLNPGLAMALEEPEYEVIAEYADFELRHYAPYIVAEVDVDGEMMEGGNSAFKILAGYIFGDNRAAEKMAMTAPVESRPSEKMAMTAPVTSTETADKTTYAFVMEKKYTLDSLPAPTDERIRIRKVPERIVAARRYSGRWTEKKYELNETALMDALAKQGIETVGSPTLARYNSPFSLPFARRNEVMIEIVPASASLSP